MKNTNTIAEYIMQVTDINKGELLSKATFSSKKELEKAFNRKHTVLILAGFKVVKDDKHYKEYQRDGQIFAVEIVKVIKK